MASVLLVRGSDAQWPPFSSLTSKLVNKLGFLPRILIRPLGLSYLSSLLREKSHECEILDLQTCPPTQRINVLREKIRKNKHDFVGFTFFTYGYPEALKMAQLCRRETPDTRIIFGGPHASFAYQEVLKNDFVDFVMIGEGERSLCTLVSNGDLRNISGLAYKDGEQVLSNPQKVIEDLDSLPFPDRERCIPVRFPYSPIDYIQTSRGCPKRCSFCVESRLFRTMRFRDPKSVVEEMRLLVKQGKTILYLADSNFSASKRHVESCCKEIRKNNLKVNLFAEMSIEYTDKEMLEVMSESCFKGVAFGIESLTNQSLAKTSGEDYKKNCLELLSCCNKLGLNCSSYYLVPLKCQNKESVIEEIKLLQSYGRVEIMFLTPFPGTALWDEANQDLLTRDFFLFDSQHIVYNPSTISLKDLIWVYRYTVKQNRRHLAIN
jgi:anaerobic magnesium-protoporphyrin IX monomethyl ester cyclase